MQKCQLKKPISRAEKIIQCGKIGNIFFAFFCGKTCQVYDGDTYSFSDVVIWLDIRRIKIPPLTSFFPSIWVIFLSFQTNLLSTLVHAARPYFGFRTEPPSLGLNLSVGYLYIDEAAFIKLATSFFPSKIFFFLWALPKVIIFYVRKMMKFDNSEFKRKARSESNSQLQ